MQAATVPTGFSETLVASGLSSPTAMQFAPDGRLFVAEQGGRLRVIKDGVLLPTPFLTVTVSSVGERGLLGVAFDPQFATNQFVYVYYTATTPAIHNRISRFTANGDVAAAGSEKILLDLNNLSSATNHNGGALAFGPDGKLYAAVGENANGAHAQTLANLHRQDAANQPGSRTHRPGAPDAHSDGQPVLRHGDGQQPSHLRARAAQPVHLCVQSRADAALHQRRRPEHVGRDQRRPRRGKLRLAEHRRELRPIRRTSARGMSTITRPAAPSPAERFTHRPRRSFHRNTSTTISLPTTAAAGSARLDPAAGNTVSHFATRHHVVRSISKWELTEACTISRAVRAVRLAWSIKISYAADTPSITSHPTSQTVAPGTSVTFSVRASGPATAQLSMAAQRRQHPGRDCPGLFARRRRRRQRRALPRHRQQQLRQRAEQ